MLRSIVRGLAKQRKSRCRIFTREKSDVKKNSLFDSEIVYEIDYFYKQDRELLEILKEKTLQDVKTMQNEIRNMQSRIDEYDKNINENLSFLKSLMGNDQPVTDKKKSK